MGYMIRDYNDSSRLDFSEVTESKMPDMIRHLNKKGWGFGG